MNTLRRLLVGAILVLGLAACGGDKESTPPGPGPDPVTKAGTTLLVYLVGSDLESNWGMATHNIEEMLAATPNSDVNVILQTGGADKDGWRTVKRQQIADGKLLEVDDLGAVNLGDPTTLSTFLEWGITTYPADQYMVAFWNHGGGPNGGFGFDENFGNDFLSLPQLQSAMKQATQTTGETFELIGFDACLMASVEVAHLLQPYGNYLAASQDVEPGPGWDWQAVLEALAIDPRLDGAGLGRVLADSYASKMAAIDQDAYLTFSITDLRKVPALVAALDDAATSLTASLSDGVDRAWLDIAYSRRHALDFSTSQFFGMVFDVVDVYSFMSQPPMLLSDTQLANIERALEEAVVHNVYGPDLVPPSGLTMFFPTRSAEAGDPSLDAYRELDLTAPLKGFVQQYVNLAQSDMIPPPAIAAPQIRQGEATAEVSNFHFATSFAVRASGDVAYAMKPAHLGNIPYTLQTPVDSGWLGIDGVPVLLFPDESQFAIDSARYTVPVAVFTADNTRSTTGLLGISYTQDLDGTETYEIDAFYAGNDGFNPLAQRSRDLPPGVRIVPLGYHLTEQRWVMRLSESFYVPEDEDELEDWSLEEVKLPSNHAFHFGVNDYLSKMRFSLAAN